LSDPRLIMMTDMLNPCGVITIKKKKLT